MNTVYQLYQPLVESFYSPTLEDEIMALLRMFNETYWPYQENIRDEYSIRECERWCYAHFKTKNWRSLDRHFAFKREEDFVLFALRWL